MFLSLDGTLIIQIINFVVFGAVLNAIFLRPVGRALAARRAHIDAIETEYQAASSEAAALRRSGESDRLAARRENEELLAKARADASNEGAIITTRANDLAHERIVKAQTTVAGEVAAAQAREDDLVHDLASNLLGRVIGAAR